MNDVTSEQRRCEVCGDPIRPDNQEGVCSRSRECNRIRAQRKRAARVRPPEQKYCKICGGPLLGRNVTGICNSRKRPECLKANRRERRKEDSAQAYRITIKAGDTFGRWTALEDYSLENKTILCRCECERGTERRIRGATLTSGNSQSCGCSRSGPQSFHQPYLTAGSVFGRLTVLEDVTYNSDRARCRCACGNETSVIATSVKLGLTRSCNCLQQDTRTKHGFSGQPLYPLWNSIMDRCTNPKHPSYHNYGGRGITICDRWRDDPWAFAEDICAEIGPRPEGVDKRGRSLYSLDRWPDNDGNYGPGNVRWATSAQQIQNRRKISDLTRDVLRLTQERDALAARVAELEAELGRP